MAVFREQHCLLAVILCFFSCVFGNAQQLPGTDPLTMDGDLATNMVMGIDSFVMRQLEASVEQRASRWNLDFSSLRGLPAISKAKPGSFSPDHWSH